MGDWKPVGYNYGAVVYNRKPDVSGAFLSSTSEEAMQTARKRCIRRNGNGCFDGLSLTNQCMAAARNRKHWLYQVADTVWEARKNALDKCEAGSSQCWIMMDFCTDGSYD